MSSASPVPSPLPRERAHTLRLVTVILAALLLFVLLAAFPYQHWDVIEYRSSIFGGILKKAQQDSEWWFCLVTPFIVGWLVWRMKKSLVGLPLQGSWLGIPPLLLGMVFYWFGYKADTAYPGYLAAQLITLGLILQLGGTHWLRQLFFPWAFLIFTWPMLPLEAMLAVPLRQMTAQASGTLLNLIGVPVMREGTGLFSAADPARSLAQGDLFQLDVEEPCSGIRSLFSLMMLAALYGWLSLKTWTARAILFASAIPLAMLGNLVRMVLLALGSLWFGSDFAIGRNIGGHQEMSFYHSMAGFMVFGVALSGMFGIATLLENRLGHPPRASIATPPSTAAGPARSWLHLGVAFSILTSGLAACALSDSSYQVGPLGLRPEMPGILGPFVSTDQPMTAREKAALAEDVRVERRFYSKSDRAIIATLVLSGAEKRSLHSPEVCLPAQGWKTGETTQIQLDLGLEKEISASLMTMYLDQVDAQGRRARLRALFIFWYHGSDGTTCASDQQHVLRTYSDAFFKNLNHRWSLLTFFVPLATSTTLLEDPYAELAALEDAKAFIRSLVPSMIVKG